MNRILQRYIDDLRRELGNLPYREQDAVLAEVRSHLEASAAALASERGLGADEAMLQATHDFGAPTEIGIQYGPQGGVVDKTTGEVLLRVAYLTGRGLGKAAVATGRGVGKALKWTAIGAGALLLVGVIVFLVLAVAYKDTISEGIQKASATRTVYQKADRTTAPRTGLPVSDAFAVTPEARSVDVQVAIQPSAGCLHVRIMDPAGSVKYDNGDGCSPANVRQSFTGNGTWHIEYTFVAFAGEYQVQATQIGF